MKELHAGWTDAEEAALLKAAADARKERLPLKTAFDAIAGATKRRPNSVRNHYYTRLNGQSVRACTLEMAHGDTRLMLRYQNKYRALLKAQPDRVQQMCAALRQQGHAVPDPYLRDPDAPHVGRPPKSLRPPEHRIRALLDALYRDLLAITQEESVS